MRALRRARTGGGWWCAVGAGAALLLGEARLAAQADTAAPVVAYTIEARLDTSARLLVGREVIDYRNPSATDLTHLYLHLYANAFRDRHTAFAKDYKRLAYLQDPMDVIPSGPRRGAVTIRTVSVDGTATAFTVDETVMDVLLDNSLKPGEALRLEIAFELKLPRALQLLGFEGTNYALALWFPKLAVVDREGWHPDPHQSFGEFYADYGRYDVTITLPSGFVVGATGELVRTVANGDGTTTLQWRAENVRDFSWVADPRYRVQEVVWNGVRLEYLYLGNERGLARGVETAVRALEFFGSRYGPYPYRHLVIAESKALGPGPIAGVEYSQLVMIRDGLRLSAIRSGEYEVVVAHEIAHQWWPGLVGSYEAQEAWLDEGFATFAARAFLEERSGRDVALLRWPGLLRVLPGLGERASRNSAYANPASHGFDSRILQPAPAFADFSSYEVAVYAKASFVLEMLEYLLGPAPFAEVMRTYVERFRYRNARTEDFIGVAEAVSGRDLRWFFDQWLNTTKTCDYSIESVDVSASAGHGYRSVIRLRRNGEIVMPVELRLTLESGEVLERVWDGLAASEELAVEAPSRIRAAELDPGEHLLETDRFNNHHPRRLRTSFVPSLFSDDAYEIAHLPVVWYDDGLAVGLVLLGGHALQRIPPAWFEQRHGTRLAVGYNFGTRAARGSLSYSNRVAFLGSRAWWGFSAARDRTREEGDVELRWLLGPRFWRGPYHTVRLALRHDRRLAAGPAIPPFDTGTANTLSARYALSTLVTEYHPIEGGVVEIDAEGGWRGLGSDWDFVRGAGRAELYRRVAGGAKLALNLFAGAVLSGTAPRQKQLLLAREGNFRASDFEAEVGSRLTAANTELRVPIARSLSLQGAVFASLGRYWGSGPEARSGTNAELGFGVRLSDNAPYGVQLDFPLWAEGRLIQGSSLDLGRVTLRVGRPFRGPGS